MLTHLSLFSGVGGIDLAAEWAGFTTVCFVENNPFCQKVLKKHWPDVPLIEDVKDVTVDSLVSLLYDALSDEKRRACDMIVLDSRYDEAVRLYERGLSIQNIADFYSVTRQAMWMILKRRGCQFKSNLRYQEENHFYRGGIRADGRVHDIVERAIERGILVRPTGCEDCDDATGTIESHHDDYNKPLEVRWLCKKSHFDWHKNNVAKELTITLPPPMTRKEISSLGGKSSHKARKEVPHEEPLAEVGQIDLLTAGVP